MKKITLSVAFFSLFVTLAARGETIVALTSGNRLLFFDSATPETVTKHITVTTFANEPLVAIIISCRSRD